MRRGAGVLALALAVCAAIGLVCFAPRAAGSVVVNGCANKIGYVHSGSNIVQACAGPAIVGGQGTGISTASTLTLDSSAVTASMTFGTNAPFAITILTIK